MSKVSKVGRESSQAQYYQSWQNKSSVQRYECKTCHQTFTETKGTIFIGTDTGE